MEPARSTVNSGWWKWVRNFWLNAEPLAANLGLSLSLSCSFQRAIPCSALTSPRHPLQFPPHSPPPPHCPPIAPPLRRGKIPFSQRTEVNTGCIRGWPSPPLLRRPVHRWILWTPAGGYRPDPAQAKGGMALNTVTSLLPPRSLSLLTFDIYIHSFL